MAAARVPPHRTRVTLPAAVISSNSVPRAGGPFDQADTWPFRALLQNSAPKVRVGN